MGRVAALHRIIGIERSEVTALPADGAVYISLVSKKDEPCTLAPTEIAASTQVENLFPDGVRANFGKVFAQHGLNRTELVLNVAKKHQVTKRPKEILWARELDKALRASFNRAARQVLVGHGNVDKTLAASGVLAEALVLTADIAHWPLPVVAQVLYPEIWTLGFCLTMFENTRGSGSRRVQDWRPSLAIPLFETQPDRYLAAVALSRLPGLVRAKH